MISKKRKWSNCNQIACSSAMGTRGVLVMGRAVLRSAAPGTETTQKKTICTAPSVSILNSPLPPPTSTHDISQQVRQRYAHPAPARALVALQFGASSMGVRGWGGPGPAALHRHHPSPPNEVHSESVSWRICFRESRIFGDPRAQIFLIGRWQSCPALILTVPWQ